MRHRRASVTLELILTLPVIIIVFFAAFQFAMKTMYQAAVVHAATVGAREAGKVSGLIDPDNLEEVVVPAVQDVLAAHCITVDDTGTRVILEDAENGSASFGDPAVCDAPGSPSLGQYEVRVTVCVDISATPFAAAFMGPLCSGLEGFGLSFAGTKLYASSLVKKELEQDLPPGP
jgi:hypothetical protein